MTGLRHRYILKEVEIIKSRWNYLVERIKSTNSIKPSEPSLLVTYLGKLLIIFSYLVTELTPTDNGKQPNIGESLVNRQCKLHRLSIHIPPILSMTSFLYCNSKPNIDVNIRNSSSCPFAFANFKMSITISISTFDSSPISIAISQLRRVDLKLMSGYHILSILSNNN